MKYSEKPTTAETEPYMLNQLVKKLIEFYQPVAVNQNSFFVNEVPQNILLKVDWKILATILGSILYIIARCGKNTCIRISAKRNNDLLVMHVKDNNSFNSYAVLSKLIHLQMLARKIGGVLDVTSIHKSEITISFSFSNKKNSRSFKGHYSIASEMENAEMELIHAITHANAQ